MQIDTDDLNDGSAEKMPKIDIRAMYDRLLSIPSLKDRGVFITALLEAYSVPSPSDAQRALIESVEYTGPDADLDSEVLP